jgi:hypothetical protein
MWVDHGFVSNIQLMNLLALDEMSTMSTEPFVFALCGFSSGKAGTIGNCLWLIDT